MTVEAVALALLCAAVIGTVLRWPRHRPPIEYDERPFLNGTLSVPRRDSGRGGKAAMS